MSQLHLSRTLRPGTIIAAPCRLYGVSFDHVGVLTDRIGGDLERTVVHLSRQFNRTRIDTMTDFCEGAPWKVVGYPGRLPPQRVLLHAYADMAAEKRWSLFSSNCEHAVARWHGLEEASPQLQRAVARWFGHGRQTRVLNGAGGA